MRIFEKNGIVKLEPLEEMFDPNFHEVMFEAPMPTKKAALSYRLLNRVIQSMSEFCARHALAWPRTRMPRRRLKEQERV